MTDNTDDTDGTNPMHALVEIDEIILHTDTPAAALGAMITSRTVTIPYTIGDALERGATPAQAIDYWLCEARGMSREEAATIRDVEHQSISQNFNAAKAVLED